MIFDWIIQIEAKLAEFKSFEYMKFQTILERLRNDFNGKISFDKNINNT